MMVKVFFVLGCSGLFLLGSVDMAPGADKLDFFTSQKIGVNIEGLQKALEAVQKDSHFRHDDDNHFLKSAEFYTRGEFIRAAAGKGFFSYALKHSPKVGAAIDKAAPEKRDGMLVLTFGLKGEGRLPAGQLMLGGSMVYFCDPVTGEVLFFRGGK